ncbi:hypothetical protein FKM82_029731, partial [Ascaphus truei]
QVAVLTIDRIPRLDSSPRPARRSSTAPMALQHRKRLRCPLQELASSNQASRSSDPSPQQEQNFFLVTSVFKQSQAQYVRKKPLKHQEQI